MPGCTAGTRRRSRSTTAAPTARTPSSSSCSSRSEAQVPMSRPLLLAALLAFALVGLAPLGCMLLRIQGADLGGVLDARTLALLGRTAWIGAGAAALAFVLGL